VVDDIDDQVLLLDVVQLHRNGLDDAAHGQTGLVRKPLAREEDGVVLAQHLREDYLDYYRDEVRNRLVQLCIRRYCTFLHLIEEQLFNSALELFSSALAEKLLTLSRMAQALVVVIDIEDDLIPEIDSVILAIAFPDLLPPLALQLGPLILLKVVDGLSDALGEGKGTRTNSTKISPLSWSLMTSASWLMKRKMSEGNMEIRSWPSRSNYS
jgi:hypothetical protein